VVAGDNGGSIWVNLDLILDTSDSDCLHQKGEQFAIFLDLFFRGNWCGLHGLKTLAAWPMRRVNYDQHRDPIGFRVRSICSVRVSAMRLVIARCTVDYDGRLTAHLPEAVRLIMVKADGCVAIHADGGAYKPLNWMNAPNRLTFDDEGWTVTSPKGETLRITVHEILSDTEIEMGSDPGLQKDGVEAHLQELLAASPETMGDGMRLVRREYPTDIGPVDLLLKDVDGGTIAVEIKRRGEIDGVEQLTRYLEFLNRDPQLRPVRGMFVAQEIKPQAKVLAADRGIEWQVVNYDDLRGIEPKEPRLF
jgi:RecB family endonuclease NucS